ncbi:MAG: hypothetical protein ACXVB9_01245 [Bdellovibrionota bacterium]
MKLALFCLALLPTLAFADVDPNIQDRIDQATQPMRDGFNSPTPAPQHGVGFVCYAKDAQGRVFESTWIAGSLDLAKQYALNRCTFFWNKGCRLTKCGKQKY